jgi:hypothetical protein
LVSEEPIIKLSQQIRNFNPEGLVRAIHLTRQAEPACSIFTERLAARITALRLLAGGFLIHSLFDLFEVACSGTLMLGNLNAFAVGAPAGVDIKFGFNGARIRPAVT